MTTQLLIKIDQQLNNNAIARNMYKRVSYISDTEPEDPLDDPSEYIQNYLDKAAERELKFYAELTS